MFKKNRRTSRRKKGDVVRDFLKKRELSILDCIALLIYCLAGLVLIINGILTLCGQNPVFNLWYSELIIGGVMCFGGAGMLWMVCLVLKEEKQ